MCACYNMTISMQGHSQKPLYMGGGGPNSEDSGETFYLDLSAKSQQSVSGTQCPQNILIGFVKILQVILVAAVGIRRKT